MNDLIFIPLGGCEQIGMNLNVYGYKGQYVIVDFGVGFASEASHTLVVPDINFLRENKANIAGMILTHIHEDHMGAMPYLWQEIQCPVYMSNIGVQFLRRKFKRQGKKFNLDYTVIDAKEQFSLAGMDFTPFNMTHSTLETLGLVIEAGGRTIVHTADWKLDQTPGLGASYDQSFFTQLADRKPVVVGDSTNINSEGSSGSEAMVAKRLTHYLENQQKQLAILMFASNMSRLFHVVEECQRLDKKLVLCGLSIDNAFEVLQEAGYDMQVECLANKNDVMRYPPSMRVYLCTGTQGEPRSGIRTLMGDGIIGKDDMVLFSSKMIPGNEKSILALQYKLKTLGCNVITDEQDHGIHVSGHPCQDEISTLYGWLQPNAIIPVHGESFHVEAHAKFAHEQCGVEHTIIPRNGDIISISPEHKLEKIDQIKLKHYVVRGSAVVPRYDRSVKKLESVIMKGYIHYTIVLNKKNKVLFYDYNSIGVAQSVFDDSCAKTVATRLESDLKKRDKETPVDQTLKSLIREVYRSNFSPVIDISVAIT